MKTAFKKTAGLLPVLLLFCTGGQVKAQAVISDPLNTVQSTLIAGNTASTVIQAVEQAKKLQTTLDYVQKVSATVRHAKMFKDLVERQNRLNSNCLNTLEQARAMKLENMAAVTSSIQNVVDNNAAIISLTTNILTSDLKMNDSERMEQLDGCLEELRRQESELAAIRQILAHSQTIKRNLGLIAD